MRVPKVDAYWAGSFACALVAVILVSLALLTNRGDLTTASLILAAVVSIITGILLLVLSRGEPMEPRIAGLLPAQGSINLCRTCADLGLKGNAHFIPGSRESGEPAMQFIPVSDFSRLPPKGDTFVLGENAHGLLVVPSGAPLAAWIGENAKLTLPGSVEEWVVLVRELFSEVLGIADAVEGGWSGDCVTLTLAGYRFSDGCDVVRRESPKCCSMNPCPVASMAGCLLADGIGRVVEVRSCTPSPDRQSVTMIFCPITGGTL